MNKKILTLVILLTSLDAIAAGGGTGTVADLKYNAINFIVLFGFLGIKLRKPLKNMFDKNAVEVTALFGLAEEKDKEAQIRFDEYNNKLKNVESERKRILAEADQNAQKFSKQHTVETDELITNLNEDAKVRIESEKVQMARNLNSTLLDEVINKVKEKVGNDKGLQEKATKKLVSQI